MGRDALYYEANAASAASSDAGHAAMVADRNFRTLHDQHTASGACRPGWLCPRCRGLWEVQERARYESEALSAAASDLDTKFWRARGLGR